MTLEELSVVFTADIAPFVAAVQGVKQMAWEADGILGAMAASFSSAGYQAAAGLRQGLLAGKKGVVEAAAEVAAAAARALKDVLKIQSPSRVTAEAGQMFDAGFLQGLMDRLPQVEQATAALGARAADALQASVPDGVFPPYHLQERDGALPAAAGAVPPVNLTLPLEIDGYRLGMAVIENLNRITGSTGRVELTI